MSIVELRRQNELARAAATRPPVNAAAAAVRPKSLEDVTATQGVKLAILRSEARIFIADDTRGALAAPPSSCGFAHRRGGLIYAAQRAGQAAHRAA